MSAPSSKPQVLFALDESTHSVGALNWTIDYIVKSPAFALTVVVVLQSEADRNPTISRIKTLLRAIMETTEHDLDVSIRILYASSTSQIGPVLCQHVEEVKPTMLVLGSAGKSHLEGFMVGSVSQYCISKAQCPVIVARLPPADESRGRPALGFFVRTQGEEPIGNNGHCWCLLGLSAPFRMLQRHSLTTIRAF
ncbi:hypothetical protein DFJ73DRAFT_959747 [Zopfochytrium polystomum]|nr:hypothetical protein DFJ73DRAFT_959747 [Zopfochytrium polystomum]